MSRQRPLPLLVGRLGDRVRHEDAGVVDEHVEAAERLGRRVDHRAHRVGVGEVGADDDVAVARQRRRDLLGALARARRSAPRPGRRPPRTPARPPRRCRASRRSRARLDRSPCRELRATISRASRPVAGTETDRRGCRSDDEGGTMARIAEISMSLDGFVAGPEPTLEEPLGEGGEKLHEWASRSRRGAAPTAGGRRGERDSASWRSGRRNGATIMGRRMFSGGEGRGTRPEPERLVGRRPAVPRTRCSSLTHHAREPLQAGGDDVHLRHRRDRVGARAGTRGGRRQGRLDRRRRRASCSSTSRPGCSTSSSSTWRRCCWATARGCSTTRRRRRPRARARVESPAVTHLRYRVVK